MTRTKLTIRRETIRDLTIEKTQASRPPSKVNSCVMCQITKPTRG